jgi:hypothetical protein
MSQIMPFLYVSQAMLNVTDDWTIWTLSINKRELKLRVMNTTFITEVIQGGGGGGVGE